jgi:hypothetical protein
MTDKEFNKLYYSKAWKEKRNYYVYKLGKNGKVYRWRYEPKKTA